MSSGHIPLLGPLCIPCRAILPRVAECASGMPQFGRSSIEPRHRCCLEKELPMMRSSFHGPIIANISGFSLDEYRECCRRIDGAPGVEIIELNVSCPNVHGGGMSFGTSCESVAEVVRAVKEVTSLPLRETFAQCHRYCLHRPCRRGRRRRRTFA